MANNDQRHNKTRLAESIGRVVVTFGRFQPPTSGHQLLINKVIDTAKKMRATAMIFPSRSHDKKKNPLKPRDKVRVMRKFFPKATIVDNANAKSPFHALKILSDQGIKDVVFIVGSDRVKEIERVVRPYINHEDPKKAFYFDNFRVISAGERDPDAEGVQGMSGSKMRAAAAEGDYDAFRSGLPVPHKEADARDLYDSLRNGMNIKEVYKKSGLGKWFHNQSAGGEPGWDRYDSTGKKAGKCGDSKEGEPYAACLSKQKAAKLGKKGVASFVRRKRKAQKSAGDPDKGGASAKGKKPVNVKTGVTDKDKSKKGIQDAVDFFKLREAVGTPPTVLVLTKQNDDDLKGTAEKLERACKSANVPFYPVLTDDAYIVDEDATDNTLTIHNYDGENRKIKVNTDNCVVFVRGSAITTNGGLGLVQVFEQAGAFVINSAESMKFCQNKLATALSFERNGIPSPRTAFVNNEDSIDIALEKIGGQFPVIVKTLTGAEGIGVSKVESYESLKSVLQSLWKFEAEVIIQEYMEIKFDVRTLVMDGVIIASAKRMKGGGDFRTNKALGNDTKPHKLSDEEKDFVRKIAKMSGCYFCGVDHIIVNGKLYALEINGSPGSGMDGYESYFGGKGVVNGQQLTNHIVDKVVKKDNWTFNAKDVGVIEFAKVEGIETKVKMDTGNGSVNAVHAEDIDVNGKKVSFTMFNKKFTKPIVNTVKINVGDGEFESRPVVHLSMEIDGNKMDDVKFSLADRRENVYAVLVGKQFLKRMNYSVNVNKKFTLDEAMYKGMDPKAALKVYNKLKRGDRVAVEFSGAMSSTKDPLELVVSSPHRIVGKSKVGRIILKNPNNMRGMKYTLYNRDGKVSLAQGDMATIMTDLSIVNESTLNECWDTHVQRGWKMKGGKRVPNCVPKNEEIDVDLDEFELELDEGVRDIVKKLKKIPEVIQAIKDTANQNATAAIAVLMSMPVVTRLLTSAAMKQAPALLQGLRSGIMEGRNSTKKGWVNIKTKKALITSGMQPYHVQFIVKKPRDFGLTKKQILDHLAKRFDAMDAPDPRESAEKAYQDILSGRIDVDRGIEMLAMKKGWYRVVGGSYGEIAGEKKLNDRQIGVILNVLENEGVVGSAAGVYTKEIGLETYVPDGSDYYDVRVKYYGSVKGSEIQNLIKGKPRGDKRTEIGQTMAMFREDMEKKKARFFK